MHIEGYRQQVQSFDKGDEVMAIHQRYLDFQEERREVKKDSSLSAEERKEKRANMKFELSDDEVKALEDNLQAGSAEIIAQMDADVVRDGLEDASDNHRKLVEENLADDASLDDDSLNDFMADLLGDDSDNNLPSNDVLEPGSSSAPELPESLVSSNQEEIFGKAMIDSWQKSMAIRHEVMPIGAALAGMLGHVEAYDAKPEAVEELGQGQKVVNHGQNLSPKKMAAFQESKILKRNYDAQVKAKTDCEQDIRVMRKEEAAKLVELASGNDDMKAKMSGDVSPKSVIGAYKALQSSYSEEYRQAQAERSELQSELTDTQQRLYDLGQADTLAADPSPEPKGPAGPKQ